MSYSFRATLMACLALSAQSAVAGSLLLMPEPLDGFIVSKAPLGSVEKPQGYLITVEKEGVIDKVQVVVEFRDLKDANVRVSAAKGYVNGFSQSLIEAGLKVSKTEIPEITPAAVEKKIKADVTFAQPDGSEILTRHMIFFSQHGYDVRTIATSRESLAELSAWAELIRPITAETKAGDR